MVGELVSAAVSDARLAQRPREYRGGQAKGPSGGNVLPPHPYANMTAEDVEELQLSALHEAIARQLRSGIELGSEDALIDAVNAVLLEWFEEQAVSP